MIGDFYIQVHIMFHLPKCFVQNVNLDNIEFLLETSIIFNVFTEVA